MLYFLNTFFFTLFLLIHKLQVVHNSPIMNFSVLMIIFLVIIILRTRGMILLIIPILTSLFFLAATQQPLKTVDLHPYPHYLPYDCKSTQLPHCVYFIYSAFFSSFLTSIHNLYELPSYKEFILDPL